jgi:hypothetical protein
MSFPRSGNAQRTVEIGVRQENWCAARRLATGVQSRAIADRFTAMAGSANK